jgi:hypothetical protein
MRGKVMPEIVWNGIVRPEIAGDIEARNSLADAAKRYDWRRVFALLHEHPDLINTTRPGSSSLYAPLHQAAYGGAPVEIVLKLIELGAWRTLQNARGERPVDVAQKRRFSALVEILTPVFRRHVPLGILLKIQSHFHAVIRGRAAKQVDECGLRLPELEPLLELDRGPIWFQVPGMYGGFAYDLVAEGVEAKLESESWCRVVQGSGQRHEITCAGSKLVEEGFV